MSTWKRILTTDDTDSVSNTNLASHDLTQISNARTYQITQNNAGAHLKFQGTVGGNLENMFRIECDGNSDAAASSYVYTPRLRIGNYTTTGATSRPGYGLPQFNSSDGDGKLLVTSDSWGTYVGETEFKTLGDIMAPEASSMGSNISNPQSEVTEDDSVLIYDESVSKFRHVAVNLFPKTFYLQTGRNIPAGESDLPHGTWYMKGVDGVLLNPSNGHGLVCPTNGYITEIFAAFEKVDGGSSHERRVNIYRNGSFIAYTAYFGSATADGGYAVGSFDSFAYGGNHISVSAGALLTFAFFSNASRTGDASHFQVNAVISAVKS